MTRNTINKILMFVLICNIMKIHCFVLRNTYGLLSKESGDYKIDILINEDDYEIIDKNQVKELSLDKIQFKELDRLASMVNNKITNNKNDVGSYGSRSNTPEAMLIVTNAKNVILTTYLTQPRALKKMQITEAGLEYQYNDLIHEYYNESQQEALWQYSSEIKDYYDVMNAFKNILLPGRQTNYSNKSIGFHAIKCLLSDYKNEQRSTKEIVAELWRIFKIWFLVYLIIAVPLWCTRGWCCCFLFCKFFKPRKTIEDARKYLLSNRPGVFKTKTGECHYDVTEREKKTYEEFEHFIKML